MFTFLSIREGWSSNKSGVTLFHAAGFLSPKSTKSSQIATTAIIAEQRLSKEKTTRLLLEKCSGERKKDTNKTL